MWEYATRDVRTVPASGVLRDVIDLMAAGSVRHVPVVDELGQLLGMVSDRDVRRALPRSGLQSKTAESAVLHTPVRELMTRNPITLDRGARMKEAVELFLRTGVGALPIVEDGALVGILSQRDVLRAYADTLAGTACESVDIEETAPTYDRPPLLDSRERPLVFIVEPNEVLRQELGLVLRASGIDLTSFSGVESLAEHRSLEVPDLILLSAEVDPRTRPLEQLSAYFPATPVVITRQGVPPPSAPRRGKGPLFLPCTPEELLARVRGEVGFCRWTHDLPALPSLAPSKTLTLDIQVDAPPQVLVVDEDPLLRRILAHHFRKLGCEVHEASDGHQALSRLAVEVFDLVTLELDLPHRSGMELLDFVRRDPERAPRMIVVSSSSTDEDVVEAFSRGALDFIRKPVPPELLAKRVARLIRDT